MIRSLGQHFLTDKDVLRDIVHAAKLQPDDVVFEIGPGKGVLTEELAKRARRVIAVELDRRLVAGLRRRFATWENVEIIHADILRCEVARGPAAPHPQGRHRFAAGGPWGAPAPRHPSLQIEHGYKVVANLPYRITSRVLRMFLEQEPRPSLLVVMVQREVAERITALPGEMSLLSLSVQYYGDPEIVRLVPKESFDPPPEVESAVIRIRPRALSDDELFQKRLFHLARLGFSSRRKQLHNLLANRLRLSSDRVKTTLRSLGLDDRVRAQELSVHDWQQLTNAFIKSV